LKRPSHILIGSTRRYRAWLLALVLLAGPLFQAANACQVCIPFPTKTLADRLLEADALVMAREDPERPFHYAAVETLKGDPGDAPIDAFLPSKTRRVLARHPERRMLLARVEPGGGWAALGIADGDYERIVRRIVQHAGAWRPMETDNRQRLAELAPLLGHADSRLHEMAYLEIGRAPYADIRRIASEVPIDKVRGMLDQPRYLEWRSLAILMLAQSTDPADRERIRTSLEAKQRLGSLLNLAAWATAYLAIEGTGGVEQIQRWYLVRTDRSREELREIVKALSVVAGAEAQMREPVAAAYRKLLEMHPSLASDVSHDLIAWHRWDFVEQIQGIREGMAGQDPLAAYALGLYLRLAAGAAPSGPALPSIVEKGQARSDIQR
jgi:hypothetical protein